MEFLEVSCYCLAQDKSSSVVYAMPRIIAERGLADEILPLDQIARRITELASSRQFQQPELR